MNRNWIGIRISNKRKILNVKITELSAVLHAK